MEHAEERGTSCSLRHDGDIRLHSVMSRLIDMAAEIEIVQVTSKASRGPVQLRSHSQLHTTFLNCPSCARAPLLCATLGLAASSSGRGATMASAASFRTAALIALGGAVAAQRPIDQIEHIVIFMQVRAAAGAGQRRAQGPAGCAAPPPVLRLRFRILGLKRFLTTTLSPVCAGEPGVRPLLRDAQWRARLQRPHRLRAPLRPPRV